MAQPPLSASHYRFPSVTFNVAQFVFLFPATIGWFSAEFEMMIVRGLYQMLRPDVSSVGFFSWPSINSNIARVFAVLCGIVAWAYLLRSGHCTSKTDGQTPPVR